MKSHCLTFWKNIVTLLVYTLLTGGNPTVVSAQDDEHGFDSEFEKTAQLIVMLRADYDGTPEFGAGIIFGRLKDRLLIATAYHVLHRGTLKPGKILVTFRAMPGKFLEATLLKHSDGDLDLAVLEASDLAKQGLNVCSLAFDRLGNPADLKRRDSVYPVGNPNGIPWAIPPEADKVSQITGNDIVFQSAFISGGHSGGGLLDKNANLVGMTTADQPPFGRVIKIDAVLNQVRQWGYPVGLLNVLPEKSTPLHAAAKAGDTDMIKNILETCAGNPNERDDNDATPLHYAAGAGTISAISILLKAGANINAQDYEGDTPLHYAMQEELLETVKYLVKAGERTDVKNRDGRSAIHWVQSADALKFLMQSGADINAADRYNYTPLQMAASAGDIERVKLLMDAGADVNKNNEYGETPLTFAVKNRMEEGVKILLKAGAKVNVHATFGYSPLMTAVTNGWEQGIKILVKAGADLHAVDATGHTALSIAVSHGKPEIATLLQSLGAKY